MEKFKVSFSADNQQLKALGTKHASDTYADIEAIFVLGNRWTDMDSVSAVWWNDFTKVATVLDSQGKCIVPHEVLTRKGCVRVNLVGSIVEGNELVTRLTSYSAEAVQVNEKIKLTGTETSEITPSQYEQFVANVKSDADRAEAGADEAEQSAQNASESATASANSASDSAQSATASEGYAQNASESAQDAETAKDDAEDARDKILGMRATAETLEAGSDATASYSDGLLTLGIPRGDKGERGIQGETGATPNLTIGTVETLAPTEDATASITGTAEEPVLNLGLPKGDTGDVSLEDLEALLPTDTASGDIASITDGQSVVPVKSLKVTLAPIQDLHGYDKPWSGGAGKNKLVYPYQQGTNTINGVTFTVNNDGSVKINGTCTATGTYLWLYGSSVKPLMPTLEQGKTYTLSIDGAVGGINSQCIFYGSPSVVNTAYGSGDKYVTFTVPDMSGYNGNGIVIAVINGYTFNNVTVKPMIRLASDTDATWQPYENICPISGRTEVVTSVSGFNVWDEETESGYINADGTLASSATALRSKNFCSCIGGQTYRFQKPTSYTTTPNICWYDADKVFIERSTTSGFPLLTAPTNARYFKISMWNYGTTYNNDISINYPSTDHEYHAYNGHTYTTTLGRTVYGGTLDVVSGVLTVTHGFVDLGTLTWTRLANANKTYFQTVNEVADMKKSSGNNTIQPIICSNYQTETWTHTLDSVGYDGCICEGWRERSYICIYDEAKAEMTANEFKTAMSGVQLCYELATPQTIQLTPQEVELLTGTNNVWSDGNVTLVYSADIQRYIEKKLNANSTNSMLTMSRSMTAERTDAESESVDTNSVDTAQVGDDL